MLCSRDRSKSSYRFRDVLRPVERSSYFTLNRRKSPRTLSLYWSSSRTLLAPRGSRYGERDGVREWWRLGERYGDGDRETEARILDLRSTLVPFNEHSDVVAFSESDSTISPSDGVDGDGGVISHTTQKANLMMIRWLSFVFFNN